MFESLLLVRKLTFLLIFKKLFNALTLSIFLYRSINNVIARINYFINVRLYTLIHITRLQASYARHFFFFFL